MLVSRIVFSMASQGTKTILKQICNTNAMASAPIVSTVAKVEWHSSRSYTVNNITKNMELITLDKDVKLVKNSSSTKVVQSTNKPLVVILSWMLAKPPHVLKFANLYMDQGFDVLTVHVSPWQMMWPVKGAQVVAGELVDFLHNNNSYEPLVLHGFSVAGYLWGEVCVKLNDQTELYKPIVDRIVGQVWDSAVDITEIPIGFPRAVFPRNKIMQAATTKYIKYHMETFHEEATKHYIRSSQMFHTNIVKAPALFLISKADPVGSVESNKRVHDSWVARGVQTTWKCWEKSPHVGHFRKHPKEYTAELYSFLDMLRLVQFPNKIQAKL